MRADNGASATVRRSTVAFINNHVLRSSAQQSLALRKQGRKSLAVVEVLREILYTRDDAVGFGDQNRNLGTKFIPHTIVAFGMTRHVWLVQRVDFVLVRLFLRENLFTPLQHWLMKL